MKLCKLLWYAKALNFSVTEIKGQRTTLHWTPNPDSSIRLSHREKWLHLVVWGLDAAAKPWKCTPQSSLPPFFDLIWMPQEVWRCLESDSAKKIIVTKFHNCTCWMGGILSQNHTGITESVKTTHYLWILVLRKTEEALLMHLFIFFVNKAIHMTFKR